MAITIAHKIELRPNNKQKTYFRKAFGCARLAYNWGLEEWERRYKAGERRGAITLNNAFNAIKREKFPFVYEVTKYACQQAFHDLAEAYSNYFKRLGNRPKFKRKKQGQGSFYICGDHIRLSYINTNSKALKKLPHNEKQKHQYLKVPNLGCVKMTECLRMNGKINNVRITESNGRFFASFTLTITEQEYQRTHKTQKHKGSVGIDMGLKHALILSNGIGINSPKPLKRNERKLKRLSRQLDKRVHARTKQERLQGVKASNNYRKLNKRLSNLHRRVANIRKDFTNKITSALVASYGTIVIETLNTKGMLKNHKLAKAVTDVAFGMIKRQLEYKCANAGVTLTKADRWYPSSKTCSRCGSVKTVLRLDERTYHCDHCGAEIDRDLNAAINLHSLVKHTIGVGRSELTPVDLTALRSLFTKNGLSTSKVEAGMQH